MTRSVFFHYTGREFDVGDRLEPQEDGFTQWKETRAMETILERYRPEGKVPRSESVFLCKGPLSEDGGFGAAGTRFCCVVTTPMNPDDQRSDMSWFREMDQGFDDVAILEEDYTEQELRALAEGYWSGEPRPGYKPMFEYRTPYAEVRLCRETEYFLAKSEENEHSTENTI